MKSIRYLSYTALFLALMILSAYIQITLPTPVYSMHITMQLFVSIVCGFCLPMRYGLLCMGIYILMGLMGIPVFASGGGIQYLLYPTFGFVLGFFVCTGICAFLRQRKRPNSMKEYLYIGSFGLLIYYLLGNVYYYFSFPLLMNTHIPIWLSLVNAFLVSIVPDLLIMIAACRTAKSLQIFFK